MGPPGLLILGAVSGALIRSMLRHLIWLPGGQRQRTGMLDGFDFAHTGHLSFRRPALVSA